MQECDAIVRSAERPVHDHGNAWIVSRWTQLLMPLLPMHNGRSQHLTVPSFNVGGAYSRLCRAQSTEMQQ